MLVAAAPQIKRAMPESGIQVSSHYPLIPVTIWETNSLIL